MIHLQEKDPSENTFMNTTNNINMNATNNINMNTTNNINTNTASWRSTTPVPHEIVPTLAYCERSTQDIPNIAEKIAAVINDARSPSHFFVGPLIEPHSNRTLELQGNSVGEPMGHRRTFYKHETSEEKRLISISAPEFLYRASCAPASDYLIDLSNPDFFREFDELSIAGSNALVNGTIFYVRLPCELDLNIFMKRISLTNIIITQELCDALRCIVVDELTLAGAVFSPLNLICPSSLHVLTLGAVAPFPYIDEKTSQKKPWIAVNHSRCIHIQRIALLNGCTWKDGTSFYCRLADMYFFEHKIDHLSTLSLTLHTTEILDLSYNFTLHLAATIHRLELHRFAPGTHSYNVVSIANDMRQYAGDPLVLPSNIDTQTIVTSWHTRGIIIVQLDNTFATLLPFTPTACWYRLFSAVEWEAPVDHTIPMLFEEDYPLLYVPPNTSNSPTKASVYIPASHEIDESNELNLRTTPFATGSFLLFNCNRTMCRVPNSSIRISPSEQIAYLPTTPVVRGVNLPYFYSWLPSNPFSRTIVKKI